LKLRIFNARRVGISSSGSWIGHLNKNFLPTLKKFCKAYEDDRVVLIALQNGSHNILGGKITLTPTLKFIIQVLIWKQNRPNWDSNLEYLVYQKKLELKLGVSKIFSFSSITAESKMFFYCDRTKLVHYKCSRLVFS
jgi:hypothetical protein